MKLTPWPHGTLLALLRHPSKRNLRRWLGIVSPSDWYAPPGFRFEQRETLPQRDPGATLARQAEARAAWASGFSAGPIPQGALTRFSTGDPTHCCGWTSAGHCGPGADTPAECFAAQPYVPQKDRETK